MPNIEQIVEQIRNAVYGREVRENIALGIEQCYGDVSAGETLIDQIGGPIVEVANTALETASDANTTSEEARDIAEAANFSINALSAQATQLDSGSQPTVQVTTVNNHKNLVFGIPKGVNAEVSQQRIAYHVSNQGITPPSDDQWTNAPAQTVAGDYLWTRVALSWNTGEDDTVFYTVSRNGSDGDGSFTVGLGEDQTYSPDANSRIELPLDDVATQGSSNLITSDAVYNVQNNVSDAVENTNNNLAIVEVGETATNNILQSQYVIWNNTLYVAKSNIEIGDELSATNLDIVQKGGLNNVSPKLVSTMTELVDYAMDTPGVPVLMTLVNGSEAQTTLVSDGYTGTENTVTECIARYYSNSIIDCFVMNINKLYMVRYNASSGEVTENIKYIPANDLIKLVSYEKTVSITAGSELTVKCGQISSNYGTFAQGVPGYTAIGVQYFSGGGKGAVFRLIAANRAGAGMTDDNAIIVRNAGTSNITSGTLRVIISFIKSDCISST